MKPDRRNSIAVAMEDLKVIAPVGLRVAIHRGDSTAPMMVGVPMVAARKVGDHRVVQTVIARKAAVRPLHERYIAEHSGFAKADPECFAAIQPPRRHATAALSVPPDHSAVRSSQRQDGNKVRA